MGDEDTPSCSKECDHPAVAGTPSPPPLTVLLPGRSGIPSVGAAAIGSSAGGRSLLDAGRVEACGAGGGKRAQSPSGEGVLDCGMTWHRTTPSSSKLRARQKTNKTKNRRQFEQRGSPREGAERPQTPNPIRENHQPPPSNARLLNVRQPRLQFGN